MADTNLSSFLWSVADLLRGDYKQSECGKVIPGQGEPAVPAPGHPPDGEPAVLRGRRRPDHAERGPLVVELSSETVYDLPMSYAECLANPDDWPASAAPWCEDSAPAIS